MDCAAEATILSYFSESNTDPLNLGWWRSRVWTLRKFPFTNSVAILKHARHTH